jgi:hypothetical protein
MVDGEAPLSIYEEETPEVVDIWEHFTTDWKSSREAEMAYLYAKKRKIPDVFLQDSTLGYFTGGPLQGRLGAVARDVSTLQPQYAVGRSLRGEKPKYLYPSAASCGCGKGDVVFNLHRFPRGHNRLIIVEGAISALSAPDCIATLGNSLSDNQAYAILEHEPKAVYYTYESNIHPYHAIRQAAKLSSRGQLTYLAPLLRGDFNDDPTQLDEVLANAIRLNAYSAPLGEPRQERLSGMRAFLGVQDSLHVSDKALFRTSTIGACR